MKRLMYALMTLLCCVTLAQGAVRDKDNQTWFRLHLGTGVGSAAVSPERVMSFLDTEITPAFPEGFTVIQALGQWASPKGGKVTRERTTVIEIYCDDTEENKAKIYALAADFVERFAKAKASAFVTQIPLAGSKLFY